MEQKSKRGRRQFLGAIGLAPVASAVPWLSGCASDGPLGAAEALEGGSCVPTSPDVEGPFYEGGAPRRTQLAAPDEAGPRLTIEGAIRDAADCSAPRAGYILDLWQADRAGNYYRARGSAYRLRGQLRTAPDGSYAFETIVPGRYPAGGGAFRPAHIHFKVRTPADVELLTSQLYFAGDPFLGPNDSCSVCDSFAQERIVSLVDRQVGGRSRKVGRFDIYV